MSGKFTARFTVALLLWCSIAGHPVRAADSDNAFQVLAIDSLDSCADLNAALAMANHQDDWRWLYTFSIYTMGYLTGINRLAFDTWDIAGGKNVKTHMVWLQRYCSENPTDSFDNALQRLVARIYPYRIIAEPE